MVFIIHNLNVFKKLHSDFGKVLVIKKHLVKNYILNFAHILIIKNLIMRHIHLMMMILTYGGIPLLTDDLLPYHVLPKSFFQLPFIRQAVSVFFHLLVGYLEREGQI